MTYFQAGPDYLALPCCLMGLILRETHFVYRTLVVGTFLKFLVGGPQKHCPAAKIDVVFKLVQITQFTNFVIAGRLFKHTGIT